MPWERQHAVVTQMGEVHVKMLREVQAKMRCSRSELLREAVERLYAEVCPDGTLKADPRRYAATDGRIYWKENQQ